VVDDGSTDAIPARVEALGAKVLRLAQNSGPACARNRGAAKARGEILFFVDADVAIAPGAVRRVVSTLEANPDLDAVFGSYDEHPRARGIVSRYRNLLHHYTHQNGEPAASTFWAACGAVRRSVFVEIGGFDANRYRYPSVEDIELGYRLRRAGHRILLDKGLRATHLKKWTLRSMIHTDVMRRAIPWARLILESGHLPNDLNLRHSQRLSVLTIGLAFICLTASIVQPELMVAAGAFIVTALVLNRSWFSFLKRRKGTAFAAACVPLHLLYLFYSGISYALVWIAFRAKHAFGTGPEPPKRVSAGASL
jgi:glycosyltransferase involved in cell wall biosynthesis